MHRPLPVAVAAVLLTAILSGCADDGGSPKADAVPTPDAFEEVQVTDTTGAIRGVVVTEAIVPIEGVLITLAGGSNATSDADGAFVFNNLEPGDYFLTASKLGYSTVQASASVVAGDKEPPVTKVTLMADPATKPYSVVLQWDGFIQCGFMAGNGFVGAQACGPLDDRFINYFTLDGGIPTYVQSEAVWESTQTLGADLSFSFYDGGTWHFKEVNGVSPLLINATGEEVADWWGNDTETLPMRMFPGNAAVSVTINQQFTAYMTLFYNFQPRQGWSFIIDGPCGTPEQCT